MGGEVLENFGDREYKVRIRRCLEYMLTERFAKFHDPFLVTRGTEIPVVAREG